MLKLYETTGGHTALHQLKSSLGLLCYVLSNPPRTLGNLYRHKETTATAAPPLGKIINFCN